MSKARRIRLIILRSLFVTLVLMAVFMLSRALAETSGTCGDNLTWVLDDDGLLTISGSGEMKDYDFDEDHYAPWYGKTIKEVIIDDGVTNIGSDAYSPDAFCIFITYASNHGRFPL